MARLEQMPEPMRSHIAKTKLPEFETQPWAAGPPLKRRRVAIVSTAGLHQRNDRPFTFELGRPLGVPNDADFQKKVLLATLKLFEEPKGPVLRDFKEDAPDTEVVDVVWACPVNLTRKEVDLSTTDALRAALKKEMVELRSWYDLALKKQLRTTGQSAAH